MTRRKEIAVECRIPPLNALKAFEAAARRLNITRAAEELSVTPGAISQQIRILEEHAGAPLFHREGRKLVIRTAASSKQDVYVQSVRFNGKPVKACWLYWDELMEGGTLEFSMGAKPNEAWGIEAPPSGGE